LSPQGNLIIFVTELLQRRHVEKQLDPKHAGIVNFLHARIFDPILASTEAYEKLKPGVRLTVMHLDQKVAAGAVQCYCSAIVGTERRIGFAAPMRKEGFSRFEKAIEEFKVRFDNEFLRR
jgi:hypothetical protein